MSRLLVMTTPELATGYRLAGVATVEVGSADEAATRLESLVAHEDGVVAVHAPYLRALPRPLRQRLETLRVPLVVALPAGTAVGKGQGRRERLLAMLRQAVGYEITFSDEARDQ
jgi:vacuolar-type H+-ATPase subunit F/Vma7